MFAFYKFKKYAIQMMLGIMPMLVFMIIFIATAAAVFIDPLFFVIAFMASIIVIAVIIIIGNLMLRHPILSMLEGKGLLTFIYDSTGLIRSFNVMVNAPNMTGVPPGTKEPLEDTYDTDLMFRLLLPETATMTDAFMLEKNEDGSIKLGEKKKVLVLPSEKDKFDHLFSFEARPTFIFNSILGKFLSRDALASFEKDIVLKHNALNILKKVQETTNHFRDFGRYAGELTKPKQGFWARNSLLRWIVIGSIIALIIFVILLFVPGFLSAFSSTGGGGILPPPPTIP